MTYIKNNKAIVFIIAVLLLSNIALLYFFLTKETCCAQNNKKPQTPREFMIEKLTNDVGFSQEQINKYVELSDKHKETMKPLFEDIRAAKDSLYKLLRQEPSDSMVNHYLVMIGDRQKAIDQRVFNHFLSLKHICTPEQQPKYDTLIQGVIKNMINPKKGGDKKKDGK